MPAVGDVFDHPRVINSYENRSPMKYRITRIAAGAVYFKPVSFGDKSKSHPDYVLEGVFDTWVKTGKFK